ncbi:helix-turn-helix domain-containing protein [Thalassovita gelatinovora]|uniref:helix-turn-helix domain-containing protein n=1 Tax=Thalassovita gelatinovora TaxID=53501 RepID=UPI00071C3BF3|nr:helix-turn-helix transcriptional regulator [Thalassovita gelatinovora]QIZ79798.1 helix-turn-helix transcriptional regulator [Thalassovita gelatinovora]
MNTDDKNKLALAGRSDNAAVAIRAKAARLFAELSQEDLANALDRRVSNISNIERGRSLPNWKMMLYFYHQHRVDLNFIVAGSYAQLPGDVQTGLFHELEKIVATTDLLSNSDRPQLSRQASAT